MQTPKNLVASTLFRWKQTDEEWHFKWVLCPLHLETIKVLLNTALAKTFKDLSTGKDEQRPWLSGYSKRSPLTLCQITNPSCHCSSLVTWSQIWVTWSYLERPKMTSYFYVSSWRYHNILATCLLTERKRRKEGFADSCFHFSIITINDLGKEA